MPFEGPERLERDDVSTIFPSPWLFPDQVPPSPTQPSSRFRPVGPVPTVIINDGDGEEWLERQIETLPPAIEENWNRIGLSRLSQESYQKLRRIARKEAGWRGPGSDRLTSESLRGFLDFWKLVRAVAVEPEFAITPAGHIQAEWYKGQRKHVDIEFTGGELAFYGLFDGRSVHEGLEKIDV